MCVFIFLWCISNEMMNVLKYSNPLIYRASRGKAKIHGKSGEVNTCSIVKHDIGGTQRGTLYQGTR